MNQLASIIIPVYNVEKYLKECLDSVLKQTYKNVEILIVDDGSTDNSGKICDSYQNNSKVKIFHQTNAGVGEARNTGLNHASGKFIFFVDSDDWVHPDFVSHAVYALEKNNADMAIFSYMEAFENGKTFPKATKSIGYNTDDIKRKIVCDDIENYAWNKAYRSHLWKNIRFTQRWFEDISLIPYVANSTTKIITLNEPLYYYRINNGSYLHQRSYNCSRDFLKLQTQQNLESLAKSFNDLHILHRLQFKVLDGSIELAILNYYLDELSSGEALSLEKYIKKDWSKDVLRQLGHKVSFMRWLIINTPALARYYGNFRYNRKCSINKK